MAKYQHCPDGCPWLRSYTLFTCRCTRRYDQRRQFWCELLIANGSAVRSSRCIDEGLPEGVKEVE